jgi:small subunit ribosomal protein S6
MRLYETAFLIAPNLSDEGVEKLIQQMAEVVSKKKGKMADVDKWGKRKLAYPIQKFEDAFYVFFLYEGDPNIPAELERQFKQSEAIIRYLTVKKEGLDELKGKQSKPVSKKTKPTPKEERPKKVKSKTAQEKEQDQKPESASAKKEAEPKKANKEKK